MLFLRSSLLPLTLVLESQSSVSFTRGATPLTSPPTLVLERASIVSFTRRATPLTSPETPVSFKFNSSRSVKQLRYLISPVERTQSQFHQFHHTTQRTSEMKQTKAKHPHFIEKEQILPPLLTHL